ncbi:hypothetical protein HN997_03715 [archaeon]|jgi:hypothetical protein|nr:hypothetical protein [archaeon]MBT6956370.1 hypothetical protein [archaeon]MBT7025861.1 hypothetical protein [archaeon]MBT7239203.1 hypothetical protein [archaeon]
MYMYLVGGLILLAVWAVLYLLRKDLRKEMWITSLILTPFGATEIFFVPHYWNPTTLFGWIPGIESFLLSFAVGGIAAVLYEFLLDRRLSKMRESKQVAHRHLIYLIVATVASTIIFSFIFRRDYIYTMIISGFVGAIVIMFLRRDLIKDTIFGGLFFFVFYFLFTLLINVLFPGIFYRVWNLENLMGVFLLDIPLEELLWGLSAGMLIAPIYEYLRAYRVTD